MEISQLLSKQISFQATAWSPISKEISIGEVLNDIKSDKYSKIIGRLRNFLDVDDIESYNINKKALPGVTFCASFDKIRRREKLKEYNSIIVIDIDKLSKEDFIRTKLILELDEYVFSFWASPSNKGFKGLINIEYDFDIDLTKIDRLHKNTFQNLAAYFINKYNITLDDSGSDTTRLCFLSHDPELHLKEKLNAFRITEFVENAKKENSSSELKINFKSSKDSLYNPKGRNKAADRKHVQAIIKYLSKRNLSITSTYEEWYKIAYAISTSFTFDLGQKYFLSLCKLDGSKFHEANCINMLYYCYENTTGNINFSTIIYQANQKGYYTNLQRSVVLKTQIHNE